VRVGLFLPSPQWPGRSAADALAETVRLTVLADRLGFAEVWLAEHHFMSYGTCPSAITLAGHLLGATGRIGVGTAVSVLPTTHPLALAEQAAMLDVLAPGRLRLGVGRGGPWRELAILGDPARHEHGFGEDLDLLRRALTDGTVAGTGPHHGFAPVPVVPRPSTPGGPPVHVAATSTATVALAADRGLPLLLGMHADETERRAMVDAWTARAGSRGDHVAVGVVHVEDDRAAARARVRAELPRWLGPGLAGYVRHDGAPRTPRDPHEYADLLCRLHPVGTVDDVVERLAASAAATGVDRVALMAQTTGDPGRTTATLEALAEVLPRIERISSRAAPGTG